jgi:glycosyltransferase involved in cell wall biosynthesis
MRILVDYRAALRERTGVGGYIDSLLRAYQAEYRDEVTLFSSSWKDRLDPRIGTEMQARIVDRRVPVRVLNLLWHRASWPPVEAFAGPVDVAHAAHPLLIPATHAAQVVTIHDLHFLAHPERTRAEIRRDYPALAASHARRAHAIITSSAYTQRQIAGTFGVPLERIYICPPGAPVWTTLGRAPNVPRDGHILFVGTLEARKNLGVVLDAYEQLLGRGRAVPRLVLAGRAGPAAQGWLDRIARAPLSAHVTHLGYVAETERERLFGGAAALVLPSLEEGFGLTALEAMSAGVPVIASNRGALPEVVGTAGTLLEPGAMSSMCGFRPRFSWTTRTPGSRPVAFAGRTK